MILQIYYICDIIKVFSAKLVHISLYDIISIIKKKKKRELERKIVGRSIDYTYLLDTVKTRLVDYIEAQK